MGFQRIALFIGVAALAVAAGLWLQLQLAKPATPPETEATLLQSPRPLGTVVLLDQDGREFPIDRLEGRWSLLFFGFTQCPDVCPTSMTEMAQAKQLLGADGDRLQGLFISIDPERDTPEIMKAYMAAFDPTFLALYAKPEELPEVAKSFKIYYKKVVGSSPETYTMDHSAGSYVYDPQGRVRLYHRYGTGAQALADDVKRLLAGG